MTYTTTGRIADEYLVLQLPKGEIRSEIVALVEKGAVSITIDKPHRPRTTGIGSQNHHLNGHIIQICNETGNDYDTVKSEIKRIAVEVMSYPYENMAGHILPKRERDCDTRECAKLIEAAHWLAGDLGIELREA